MLTRIDEKINRATLFLEFNYAFRNLYSDDFNFIPPTTGYDRNEAIRFYSREKGTITVDWGDGSIENFNMVHSSNGYYVAAWRSYNIDYVKNPNDPTKGWYLGIDDTGNYIIPYPNHHYADDRKDVMRKITFSFSCDIYKLDSPMFRMNSFPILEMENLEELTLEWMTLVKEVPYDRISKLKKLTSLSLSRMGNKLQIIPESLFNLSKLKTLKLNECFNLSNPDSSNIRKISKLQELETLMIHYCDLIYYIKEFNDLPKLNYLDCSNQSDPDISPDFNEVSEINQNLTWFDFMNSGSERTNWADLSGKKIQNLKSLPAYSCNKITLILPQYLKEMRGLTSLDMSLSLQAQDRADSFVDNLYGYIISWNQLTMTSLAKDGLRNQFYGIKVIIYIAAYPRDFRPSGTYQAPSGFVQGSNNGNPLTPMEKIYVLTKNYNQTWTVRP